MNAPGIRVAQVSDESGVGQALAAALGDRTRVTLVPARQVGARWKAAWKPVALLPRYLDAWRTRLQIERLRPRPDVLHIHWLPNGLVGAFTPRGATRIPWVLHVHGSDIRGVSGWRLSGYRRLLRAADAVVFSTPDLAPEVQRWRPDAEHLPAPIAIEPLASETRWDAVAPSAALPVKGAAATFAALRLLAESRPSARLAAMTGPVFEEGPWEELPLMPHPEFLRVLASTKVVVGQLKLGILSVVELEAMAIGKPIVGWTHDRLYSESPPMEWGALPGEVARATLRLIDDRSRRFELAELGQRWVREHHDPEAIARHLLAIYERVLASPTGK